MKTILSIDGGGVRALISAVVAQRLERYLAEISGNPDSRLCDFFDLFAGTSAGGILAAAYLCPEKDGRPRSASEITEIFAGMSKRVFRRSPLRQGLLRPKYSSSALKKTLYGLFGDVKFSELGGELMLTAFDMEHGRCFFFNTHSASLSERRDYRVADAALATSAAPVYFPPASITSVDDTHKLLADGGLYANNPAVCAYVEAHKLYGSEPLLFLSLGNIRSSVSLEGPPGGYGLFKWAYSLLDSMFCAQSQAVDYQLRHLFKGSDNYLRIDIDDEPRTGLDHADSDSIAGLIKSGERLCDSNDGRLRGFARCAVALKAGAAYTKTR